MFVLFGEYPELHVQTLQDLLTHVTTLELAIFVAHEYPHEPQFLASSESVTHMPLHAVCPNGHEVEQIPLIQACPDGHCLPHVPQL